MVGDQLERRLGAGRAEVVQERRRGRLAGGGVAELLVRGAAEPVDERAEHLALDQHRVEHRARVVHRRDPVQGDEQGVGVDAHADHLRDEAVAERRVDPCPPRSPRRPRAARTRPRSPAAAGAPAGSDARVPVHDPGRVPEEARRPGRRVAHGAVRQLQPGRVDAEQDRGPGAHRLRQPVHRGDHGAGHQRREPRGVAARGHRPRRRGGVHVDDRAHLLDRQPQPPRGHPPGHAWRGPGPAGPSRAAPSRRPAGPPRRARSRSSRTCPAPACRSDAGVASPT